jgi:WS/DGAT/MGAT family acyltransferase
MRQSLGVILSMPGNRGGDTVKHLSGLDSAFLYLETPETPMHVGGLNLVELPAGYRGDFHADVKRHVASRLHLAAVFTRRLAATPLDLTSPVWIDGEVDLDAHVRRVRLPKPGSMAQLEACVARLHGATMDRSRPLWEFHVIEGLADGRVGFYSKVHHAAIDGQAGVALAQAILDTTAEPRQVPVPVARPAPATPPGAGTLLKAALANQVRQTLDLARLLPGAARAAGALARDALSGIASAKTSGTTPRNWLMGPRTPLNTAITARRSFVTASISLGEVRAIGRALDASINDVVLTLCSGALKAYLADLGSRPRKPLVAAVPVSLRAAGDTAANNQATMTLVNLHTHQADAAARLAAIRASTAVMKAQVSRAKSVLPTDFPTLGMPWLIGGMAALYGRSKLADRITPLANVVISNVPGPPVPLYLAGARLTAYYPVSIVVHGLALNITVQSYAGSLDFGLIAARDALPDLRRLARHLHEEFAALTALAANAAANALASDAPPKTGRAGTAVGKRAAAQPRRTKRRRAA